MRRERRGSGGVTGETGEINPTVVEFRMEIEVLFHVILSTALTRIKPPFAIESPPDASELLELKP